jgi:Holliday junction DNA helicase RuvB
VEEVLYPAMEDYALDIVIGKGPAARFDSFEITSFYCDRRYNAARAGDLSIAGPVWSGLPPGLLRSESHAADRSEGLRGCLMWNRKRRRGRDCTTARGTPRVALRLLRRVRDYSQVRADGRIDMDCACEALNLLAVDKLGLDEVDRRVLSTIIEKYSGGPVGLATIAASISEEPDTIMDVVEPYLLQLGFIDRTPQGRVATKKAYEHLGKKFTAQDDQPRLIE